MNFVWPIVLRSRGSASRKRQARSKDQPFPRDCFQLSLGSASQTSILIGSSASNQDPRTLPNLKIEASHRQGYPSLRGLSHSTGWSHTSLQRRGQSLSFQEGNLSAKEITIIFGQSAPPTGLTNQLLRVLHGRRVDGTLDLPLPNNFDATLRKYPSLADDGLRWLRENYPIDEDEAIIHRIEREEAQQEKQKHSDLMRRGEELGLYKPQSGNYQARLSETDGDVFGVSQIEEMQAKNIKKAEQDEEELQREIDEIQEQVQEELGQLAVRLENSLETTDGIRPPNSFEKWILRSKLKATSKLTLDAPEVAEKGPWRRLFPSFFFVAVVTGLCYLYAVTYIPPKRSERMFPEIGLAFATISSIIATNFFVYALWKWPPAWRMLNRYFITVPGMPVPLSLLGNVFSHQTFKHVGVNMIWILIFGLSLHEDVGRGNFLAVYVAGGAIGSFVSASSYVFRGVLFSSHLGASGAVSAVLAAYCMVHATDRFTFFVIPKEWQDTISFTGIQFFACMILWEAAQFISIRYSARYRTTDFAAHFGGYVVGAVAGWRFRQDKDRNQHRKSKSKMTWIDHLFGRKEVDGQTLLESSTE